MNLRLFDDENNWTSINDGNITALNLFKNHYSFRSWRQRNGKNGKRFVGPGEQLILLSKDEKALLVWKKEIYRKDNQTGICCSIFRNESNIQSSKLITEAMNIAMTRWPDERLYTFVNSNKIKSNNPGCCFKKAGWIDTGLRTTKGLHILEYIPIPNIPL